MSNGISMVTTYQADNLAGAPQRADFNEAWADRQRGLDLDALFEAFAGLTAEQKDEALRDLFNNGKSFWALGRAQKALESAGLKEALDLLHDRVHRVDPYYAGTLSHAAVGVLARELISAEDYDQLTGHLRAVGALPWLPVLEGVPVIMAVPSV